MMEAEECLEEKFQAHISEMKVFLKEGNVKQALKVARQALTLRDSEKLQKRIAKMEDYLLEIEENSEGEDVAMIGEDFFIPKQLDNQLYPYQREGVTWLYQLFVKNKGGILADDMGLGKTIQTISFLSGLFDGNKISHALIIMPATLISNWTKEFEKWSPSLYVCQFHGDINSRQRELASVQRKEGILLTTYGLVTTSAEVLSKFRGREFVWDCVILDEGHKIKNPTKCRAAVNEIPAKNRIILTGTPIQNNLSELWSLFDFVHHGTLLGTRKTFKIEYETPITRSREKNASAGEKKFGEEMAKSLMNRVKPYLLRRTKAEILEKSSQKQSETGKQNSKVPKPLIQKNDFVIWLPLSEDQIRIYQDFLHLDRVKEILMTKRSPLVELTVLKKICDHPRLLSSMACSELGLEGDERFDNDDNRAPILRLDHIRDETLLNESSKLRFLLKLMKNLKSEGHRMLIFSQSRKMLDIIKRILENDGFRLLRLDGTITHQIDRQRIIQKFETNHSYSALLLTIQVGGVGLNLTSADRVIIYDPSWNPATDSQAIDRAYRIGQEKPVVVYRLITCATVEEKIYRRQVFKESIYKETTGGCQNTYRYFTSFELRDMFTLDNPLVSQTQVQLEQLHSQHRKTTTELDGHIAALYSFEIFGISDNDLLFSLEETENVKMGEVEVQYMDTKIDRASKLIEMECQLSAKARIDQGLFKTPQLPTDKPEPKKFGRPRSPDRELMPTKVPNRKFGDFKTSIYVSSETEEIDVSPIMLVKDFTSLAVKDRRPEQLEESVDQKQFNFQQFSDEFKQYASPKSPVQDHPIAETSESVSEESDVTPIKEQLDIKDDDELVNNKRKVRTAFNADNAAEKGDQSQMSILEGNGHNGTIYLDDTSDSNDSRDLSTSESDGEYASASENEKSSELSIEQEKTADTIEETVMESDMESIASSHSLQSNGNYSRLEDSADVSNVSSVSDAGNPDESIIRASRNRRRSMLTRVYNRIESDEDD